MLTQILCIEYLFVSLLRLAVDPGDTIFDGCQNPNIESASLSSSAYPDCEPYLEDKESLQSMISKEEAIEK